MANMHLVTGYAGQEHITAADQGAFNTALLGSGQFVLGKGNRFSASVVTNNLVRVLDGDLYMQGRYVRLNEGTYADLTIENGASGMKRNDLIVARYTQNASTGVEEVNLVVIKGTSVASGPVDPAYTSGDLIEAHDIQNDMPLYRIALDGLNVGTPEQLFTVWDETLASLANEKQDGIDRLTEENSIADADCFGFYDQSISAHRKTAWSNIKNRLATVFSLKSHTHSLSSLGAAASSHGHSADQITSGILSAARGGTGLSSLSSLATALGVPKIAVGTYVGTGTFGEDNPTTLAFDFKPKLVIVEADYAAFNTDGDGGGKWVLLLSGINKIYNTCYGTVGGEIVDAVWEDNSVKLYCDDDYTSGNMDNLEKTGYAQLNGLGVTYHYFAIG